MLIHVNSWTKLSVQQQTERFTKKAWLPKGTVGAKETKDVTSKLKYLS